MAASLRACWLSAAVSAVTATLILLGSSSQIQGNPLVYPNRFSFQKTSTTSTTQVPLYDHDRSNNSLSSVDAESGYSSKHNRRFRYDIAAWVIGVLFLVCLIFVIFYSKMKRRNALSSSTCYPFPVAPHLKSDLDSSSIIANTNSDVS